MKQHTCQLLAYSYSYRACLLLLPTLTVSCTVSVVQHAKCRRPHKGVGHSACNRAAHSSSSGGARHLRPLPLDEEVEAADDRRLGPAACAFVRARPAPTKSVDRGLFDALEDWHGKVGLASDKVRQPKANVPTRQPSTVLRCAPLAVYAHNPQK